MTQQNPQTTLRLLMPQWQGGNNAPYHFGAQLLDWLSPPATGPMETVEVAAPDGRELAMEDGIVGRRELVAQLRAAEACIARHRPERIAVLGGDCLVDLAPFAYLNERYDGELAVLWIDAHPDIMTPKDYPNAHAMVLGNLLGEGDADFSSAVRRPLRPTHVMYAGLNATLPVETEMIARLGLRHAGPSELTSDSGPVLRWLEEIRAKRVAIHFDLDVLDASRFRSLLFANPETPPSTFDGVTQGSMTIEHVTRLICDVAAVTDVVGIGITEHLPWDALAMKTMLSRMPLLGTPTTRAI
ncbi:arginase family protein [Paraburkholderia tropica]|uniref:arginase family protein n=1 Tax=Paraburkholderia tropica TaxID=92647 RepID=UPI001591A2B8|nr:arginase family protein [Paraburkholderia tropica]